MTVHIDANEDFRQAKEVRPPHAESRPVATQAIDPCRACGCSSGVVKARLAP
jgi:hypothetical protein